MLGNCIQKCSLELFSRIRCTYSRHAESFLNFFPKEKHHISVVFYCICFAAVNFGKYGLNIKGMYLLEQPSISINKPRIPISYHNFSIIWDTGCRDGKSDLCNASQVSGPALFTSPSQKICEFDRYTNKKNCPSHKVY